MGGLFIFVENKVGNRELDYESFFITDEWMNDAYEVLRNGGSIDPIIEPIEVMVTKALQEDKEGKHGIYGTLDDTRTLNDSTGEIYETVMYDASSTPGIEK